MIQIRISDDAQFSNRRELREFCTSAIARRFSYVIPRVPRVESRDSSAALDYERAR